MKFLQLFHLIGLVIVIILILIFGKVSNEGDDYHYFIQVILYVTVSIWPFLTIIFYLFIRRRDNSINSDTILMFYRKLLISKKFLIATDIFIAVFLIFIAYLFSGYRQVTVQGNVDGIIVKADIDQSEVDPVIGYIEGKTPFKKRMKVQDDYHVLIFEYKNQNKVKHKPLFIKVLPYWKNSSDLIYEISFK